MEHESQAQKSPPAGQARIWLGACCALFGVLCAWGFLTNWAGEVASEEARDFEAGFGALARWSAASLLGLSWTLAWILCRPGTPRRSFPRWLPLALVLLILVPGALLALRVPSQESALAPSFEVEVIGQQFEWLVRYPGPDGRLGRVRPELVHALRNPAGLDAQDPAARDDVLQRARLSLPLGETSRVHLRSLDVLHSFHVESLRVQGDLLPGYPSSLRLRPTCAGEHAFACAGLCGLGHSRMTGTLSVLPRAELERWLAQQEPWL